MSTNELITLLEKGYDNRARISNRAIRKAYMYSKKMFDKSNAEKEQLLLPLLRYKHIYVQYWGAVIALSYNILEYESIKTLLDIIDIDVQTSDNPFRLNLLKGDIASDLYAYKKYGVIGSFPEHHSEQKIIGFLSDFNYKRIIRYYKKKLKKYAGGSSFFSSQLPE